MAGEDASPRQPLEGIKVADFSWAFAGPIATKYLAIFGAKVVKIETHSRPDSTRIAHPFLGKPSRNSSTLFGNFGPSKLSISLNLNMPAARTVAGRLVAWADVVVENFSAGQMAEWGLGYQQVRELNPAAIMLSSSQQGQTGPHAAHPGLGGMLQALAGFNHFTGYPDRVPRGPAIPYPDLIAPWFSIVAIVAALEHRQRTGKGQYLDLSQLEASLQFLAPALLDYSANGRAGGRRANASDEAAPHNAYRCRGDDRWCAISVSSDEEWRAFRRVIGDPAWVREARFASLAARVEHARELDGRVTAWTREREAEEIMRLMQEAGVPAGVVANGRDLHHDPQLRHRGHFAMVEHPRMGSYPVDAPAFRILGTPPDIRPSPLLGQHNETVCRDLLAMSEEEYGALEEKGIFS
ncbi:MAG: CoA transferase [Dehalococcoidia bacterium]